MWNILLMALYTYQKFTPAPSFLQFIDGKPDGSISNYFITKERGCRCTNKTIFSYTYKKND